MRDTLERRDACMGKLGLGGLCLHSWRAHTMQLDSESLLGTRLKLGTPGEEEAEVEASRLHCQHGSAFVLGPGEGPAISPEPDPGRPWGPGRGCAHAKYNTFTQDLICSP